MQRQIKTKNEAKNVNLLATRKLSLLTIVFILLLTAPKTGEYFESTPELNRESSCNI